MRESQKKGVKLIAIAGGSASGKTTVARLLCEKIGTSRAVILGQDSYYKGLASVPKEKRREFNFDHPAALDLNLFAKHLKALKKGETIEKPVYSYRTHSRLKRVEHFCPKEFVIAEGLFTLLPQLCRFYDFKMYVDAPDDVRLARRVLRDVKERGRTIQDIIAQYFDTVRPMHQKYVTPTLKNADCVVGWQKQDLILIKQICALINPRPRNPSALNI